MAPRADRGKSVIEYRVLGPLEVVVDGRHLSLGSRKQRMVLAALLMADGHPVSVDRLISAVWAGHPPARADAGLQVYISRLRSLLPREDLIRQPPGYRLNAERTDLAEFRRLAADASDACRAHRWDEAYSTASAALALWRAPLLADIDDRPWVRAQATDLEEVSAQCSFVQITALLGQSRVVEAESQSGRLVEKFPLRERTWQLRMIALHRAGRTPDALDSFQEFADVLNEQLGLEPSNDLRSLQTAIIRQDPAIRSWPVPPDAGRPVDASATVESAPAPPPSQLARQLAPIVGRDGELAVIDESIAAAASGRGCCLVLSGPPGIGKTRLAAEAADRALRLGFEVAMTRCPDDDATPAWWPLRDVVVGLGGDPDRWLRPAPGTDADAMRYRMYEDFAALVAAAGRPVLLVIDDLQWIDSSSLGCLRYLAESVGRRPVMIMLTVRDDGRDRPDLQRAWSALGRNVPGGEVELPPLDAGAAGDLLGHVSAEPVSEAEVVALTRRTGGNPFLLIEYARLPGRERVAGRVPPAVRALLDRSLQRVSGSVLAVLRAAAVVGDVFEINVLAEVVGASAGELIDVVDAAAAASIVVPDPSAHGYRFAHALLRDQVMLQVSAVRRQAWHARTAEVLARRGDYYSELRRAQHLSAALPLVDPAVVVAECEAVALDAQDRWDWDTAAALWEEALRAVRAVPGFDPARRDDFTVFRLEALARAGDGQTVFDTTEAAVVEAIESGRLSTIGRLVGALLRTLGGQQWTGRGYDSSSLERRVVDVLDAVADDPATHARVLTFIAVAPNVATEPGESEALIDQAVQTATALDDPDVLADTLFGRVVMCSFLPANRMETVELLDRLHRLPHRLADVDDAFRHNVLTKVLFWMGEMDAVVKHLGLGIAASGRLRLPASRIQLRWMESTLAQWRGDFDVAREIARHAFEVHRQAGVFGYDVCRSVNGLTWLWHRGRLADGADLIAGSGDPMLWKALSAIEAADHHRARELLDRRLAEPETPWWFTLAGTTLLAHAAADLRAAEPARVLLARLSPFVDVVASAGQTASIGPVALATGRLHAVLGDTVAASADLAVSRKLAQAGGGAVALLRTRYEHLLLEPGRPSWSSDLHDIAVRAEELGMSGLAAAAHRMADE